MKTKTALLVAYSLQLAAASFAQTEKFDIASFIPPQGWQRFDSNGRVSFSDLKTVNGLTSFCHIILFPSHASSGNAGKDFKAEWNQLVALPTKSTTKPKTATSKTPEGWNITRGVANISGYGMSYTCMLVTATGFGKTMSIMVTLAGNDYTATIEKFFNDLDLDSKAVPDNQTNMNGTLTINNYDFTAPDRWFTQKHNEFILLSQTQSAQDGCYLQILAPQPSSGDLEQDAKNVFNQMYPGWQYRYTGERHHDISKGYTMQGLEYCMMEAGMSVTTPDGRYNLEDGAALVIKTGRQIIIIAARHNRLLACECGRNYNLWKRFFKSFTVRNVEAPNTSEEEISKRIVGLWKTAESMVISDYVFAANGHYQHGGAIGATSTTSDFNYEYIHYKTYSWEGDGSYIINGNLLTLHKRNSKDIRQIRLRFEKVNHGGTGWKDRMYMLTTDIAGENEARYEKQAP